MAPRQLSMTINAISLREQRRQHPERWREYNRRARIKNTEYYRAYTKIYAPKARERHLLKKYGLTSVAWEALFDSQNRRCAICRRPDPGQQWWHTDHAGPLPCTPADVRGILCCFCNHAVGAGSRVDALRLRRTMQYVEKFL